MAIRTNSDSFVPPKITTKYTAAFEMCGSRIPTHAAHRNHTNALLMYLWYTDRIPGNVPGRTIGRAAAAAVVAADVSTSNFVGRELPVICHWSDCTLQFGGALSRTPAPREGEFHRHLSHGIIGKRASSREWPLAHNVETVHTNVGQACTIAGPQKGERHSEKEKFEGEKKPITFVCRAWRKPSRNHRRSTPIRNSNARVSRPPRPFREYNYVGRLALRHCVHLAVWLFHERPKTSAGGDRGRCRLRRTERYAQFDRQYNTIENITGLLPLSLSLDRLPRVSPPRFPARFPLSVFCFFFFLHILGQDR